MLELPQINEALCNGCGLCLTVCDCGSLVLVGQVVKIIHAGDCGYCTNCELVCPTGAISTGNMEKKRREAEARVSYLKTNGFPNANIYPNGFKTQVIWVLLEPYYEYGLVQA